jgi:hypothetical protein
MRTFATVILTAVLCVVIATALFIGGIALYFYVQAALGNNPFQ